MTADFFQPEPIARFLERLGTGDWFEASSTRHLDTDLGKDTYATYCALVPKKKVPSVLQHFSWDLSKGDGRPGFSIYGRSTRYHRFGDDDGIEPLVFLRDWHGLKPSEYEVSEEFRHFHDLFEEPSGVLLRFDEDDGISEEVGHPLPAGYELRMRDVREYLAARNMYLALFFDITRVRGRHVPKQEEIHEQKIDHEALLCYAFNTREDIARLVGKKLIPPLPRHEIPRWPFTERRRKARSKVDPYESFVIGRDPDGASSNPPAIPRSSPITSGRIPTRHTT